MNVLLVVLSAWAVVSVLGVLAICAAAKRKAPLLDLKQRDTAGTSFLFRGEG